MDSVDLMDSAKSIFLATAFTAVLFAATACNPSKVDVGSDGEVTRASYLIDQGQYSEAIFTLGPKVKSEPKNERARLMLASAYASRAGLKFLAYKEFVSSVLAWDQASKNEIFSARDPLLNVLAQAIWRIQVLLHAFETVPVPTSADGYADVREAVRILDEAGRLRGGSSYYRALLRVVIFKKDLVDRYRLTNPSGCHVEIASLIKWFSAVEDQMEQLGTDVAWGNLDEEKRNKALASIAESRRTIDRARSDLSNALRGVPGLAGSGNPGGANLEQINRAISQDPSCR